MEAQTLRVPHRSLFALCFTSNSGSFRTVCQVLDQEIRHAHLFRIALSAPFAAGVLEIADQFLLRIDGYGRPVLGQRRLDRVVDDPNCLSRWGLSAPSPVLRLACRLNLCFFSNSPTTVWLTLCPSFSSSAASRRRLLHVQRSGDVGSRRARPVCSDRPQSGVGLHQRLASPARPANPIGRWRRRCIELLQTASDRAGGDPRNPGDRCRPAPPPGLPPRQKAVVAVHPIAGNIAVLRCRSFWRESSSIIPKDTPPQPPRRIPSRARNQNSIQLLSDEP